MPADVLNNLLTQACSLTGNMSSWSTRLVEGREGQEVQEGLDLPLAAVMPVVEEGLAMLGNLPHKCRATRERAEPALASSRLDEFQGGRAVLQTGGAQVLGW